MKALLTAATLLITIFAFAQQPSVAAQANTIYVGADGRFEAPPDTALVQFDISAQEETSRAAYERVSRAAEQIREILRSNTIDPKEARIGFFSLAPVYDWRSPKRKLVGYRVSSSVSLKLKDFSKIAPIVQQLADMDVTGNESVSYVLDDLDAAKLKAVDDAFQRARAEAAAVARAGGRSLGELSYASVDTFEQVRVVAAPRVMTMAAGADRKEIAPVPTAEFTPQNVVVTAHVNTMFVMK